MGKKQKKASAKKATKQRLERTFEGYLARAYYASPEDLAARVPELQPLRNKTIAAIGLGCLGAPSVLEFARAGAMCICLVDHDTVDPATTVRWPIGFTAAGQKKVHVLHETIRRDYPYTETEPFDLRVGQVRHPKNGSASQQNVLEGILSGVDLIYDSTAELGVQHFLTDYAWNKGITYIGVSGTIGGWGGKVFRIYPRPDKGCWLCYRMQCDEGDTPEPPSAPSDQNTVQPTGCADPTFTGASFDMLQVAIAGVRMAVSTLCEGVDGAYPSASWDAVHLRLRADDGSLIVPTYSTYTIVRHPECPNQHDTCSKQQ